MQRHHRLVASVGFATMVAATSSTLHAISTRRCARKCTFTTGRCVVDRGAQCHDAVPAAPCYQALDQQCQREAVAACVESGGKSCKRRPCSVYRELWCECQALAPPDEELP